MHSIISYVADAFNQSNLKMKEKELIYLLKCIILKTKKKTKEYVFSRCFDFYLNPLWSWGSWRTKRPQTPLKRINKYSYKRTE